MKFLVTINVYRGDKVTMCKLLREITGSSLRYVKAVVDTLDWERNEIVEEGYGCEHTLILTGDQVGMLDHTWHDGNSFPDSWGIISVKRLTQSGIDIAHLGCDYD